MIQEAIANGAQIVRNHWTGGISGAVLWHFCLSSFGWLKANNGLRGAWSVIIGTKQPPILKTNVTVISPAAPAENLQPKT